MTEMCVVFAGASRNFVAIGIKGNGAQTIRRTERDRKGPVFRNRRHIALRQKRGEQERQQKQ